MGYVILFVIGHGLLGAIGSAVGLAVALGAGDKLLKLTVKNFCISQSVALLTIAVSLDHSVTEVLYHVCAIFGSLIMYVLILRTSMFFRKPL